MSEQIPGYGNVRIEVDGLMVGRYDESNKTYEVGILPAPVHALSIKIEEIRPGSAPAVIWELPVNELQNYNRVWHLEVEGRNPDAELFLAEDLETGTGWFNRNIKPHELTSEEKKKDFRWMMDLEKDFPEHQPTLDIRKEVLWPIIQIKNGQFYTHRQEGSTTGFQKLEFKSGLLTRFSSFGYAGELAAADLRVRPDEEQIVLRSVKVRDDELPGTEIYTLPIRADSKYVIKIENVPTHSEHDMKVNERSHFQFYYMLFNVEGKKWYDFARIVESGVVHTHHHVDTEIAGVAPDDDLGTPNPFRCAIGHLGNRSESLE